MRAGFKFAWIPLMQRVRRHPDFKSLMRELGIVDYWRQAGWPSIAARSALTTSSAATR
jgi:hypothetical protein